MAKLFADAGIICIACLISPYIKERDACRALLSEGDFIEVCGYLCQIFCFWFSVQGHWFFCVVLLSTWWSKMFQTRSLWCHNRYTWMCHFKCVKEGTQKACTSLHEQERSKVSSRKLYLRLMLWLFDFCPALSVAMKCLFGILQVLQGLMIHMNHH